MPPKKRDRGVKKAIECVDKCMGDKNWLPHCFTECYLGSTIVEADVWISHLKEIVEEIMKLYGFVTVTFSREFGSFVKNPVRHLEKKLFIYTHDFIRGRISKEVYAAKALMAINTSYRTNLRTLYQNWGFLAILKELYREGTMIVYPEHEVLDLERSGKQKLRWIPPNLIVDVPGYGSLSFFIEAPRPLAWGDTGDLKEIWGLYVAFRPDLLVYGGRVYDIVEPDNSPPIKRPDIIIEFKELPDWYRRVRDVKGPLSRPLSAEEWRVRWIEGLWDGLADVLGVSRREAIEKVKERKGIRLDETRVVQLYRSVYNPKTMFLVSKHKVPDEVRRKLEAFDIIVVDDVGFVSSRVKPVAEKVLDYAVSVEEYILRIKDKELAEILFMVKDLWEKGVLDREKLRRLLTFALLEQVNEKINT